MPWAKRIGGLLCAAVTGCLTLQPVPGHAALVDLVEDFGNFPDAVAVTGQYGDFVGLSINGDPPITATGFKFNVSNTSWGDGAFSSFVNNPDGNFATDDVLTPAVAAAIAAAQPFGIFSFTAHVAGASVTVESGPTQFHFSTASDEVVFEIMPPNDGLVFDPVLAPPPPPPLVNPIFTNPEFGTVMFFVGVPDSTPFSTFGSDIDVSTELAWFDATLNGGLGGVQTMLLNRRFRPRGELEGVAAVPIPPALPLFLSALAALGFVGRRQRRAVA